MIYFLLYQIQVVNQISKVEKSSELREIGFQDLISQFLTSMLCRLEDECLKRKGKLKIRLKSDVNLITFNSSFFSGSSLHCHLGKTSSDLFYQNILIA